MKPKQNGGVQGFLDVVFGPLPSAPLREAPVFSPRTQFDRPSGKGATVLRINGTWPRVHISRVAHSKMWGLVQECDIEVSWLSTVTKLTTGDFRIDDVFVPEQECTGGSTEITPHGEAELLEMLLQKNGGSSKISRLCCWGHSHVNMGVFASYVDEMQTEEFLTRNNEFFIRLIANKRGDLSCTLYLKKEGLYLCDPTLVVAKIGGDRHRDWAKAEIERSVQLRPQWHCATSAYEEVGESDHLNDDSEFVER